MTELVPFQLEISEELELLELVSSDELLPLELVLVSSEEVLSLELGSSLPDPELGLEAEGQVDCALETESDGRKGAIPKIFARQSGHTRPC